MYLPETDEISVKRLTALFDNMSESYKIFWFQAIVDMVHMGKTEISFSELINQMIADAWYMVTEYKLNLGPSDTLEKLVLYIFGLGKLKSGEKKENIIKYLDETDDKEIIRKRKTLTYNVPYRLQAPFLQDVRAEDWKKTADIVEKINNNRLVMYKIVFEQQVSGVENKRIAVVPKWIDYIKGNYTIIKGWIQFNLITYLQRRNPNVPGIASKLYAPMKRQLTYVQRYWKAVMEVAAVPNIYNGREMQITDISIDHFVPWSYVAHDEMWNLIPTSKSVNSSKGNSLPDWDKYFIKLFNVEYDAMRVARQHERIQQYWMKCQKEHVNSEEIKVKLYREGIRKEVFGNILAETIEPVYMSAKSMGFGRWICDV